LPKLSIAGRLSPHVLSSISQVTDWEKGVGNSC